MIESADNKKFNTQKIPFRIIFITALIAGTLDISSALIDSHFRFGTTPIELFQYIASGIFGRASFSGGLLTAFAGLISHYFIAFSWTFIFFLLYPKLKITPKLKIVSGLVYGIFVWLVMNLIVVPFSRAHKPPFHWGHVITAILYLMFFIGLPISISFHKYYLNK